MMASSDNFRSVLSFDYLWSREKKAIFKKKKNTVEGKYKSRKVMKVDAYEGENDE